EKIASNGSGTPFGNGGNHRHGLAFDNSGNLYAADYGSNNITEFAPNGSATVFANSHLNCPTGIAFDTAGNLYFANANANNIVEFSTNGTYIGVFTSTGLQLLSGMTIDSAGNLYIANSGKVSKYPSSGTYLGLFANVGGTWVMASGPYSSLWNGSVGNWSEGI